MEKLTKRFRITDMSLFMIPGNKSKCGLQGGNKMVLNVIQGIISIDGLLVEVEIAMLEVLKLT